MPSKCVRSNRTVFCVIDENCSVLEQADASVILTGSNSDDDFIDMLREYSRPSVVFDCREMRRHYSTADISGAFFQIRPRKDFLPAKGRDRLLSLGLFAQLPEDHPSTMDIDVDHAGHGRTAYEFMQKRRDTSGDPTQIRWNAMIRLSNFTSVDSSPLCVSLHGFVER